MTTTFTIPADRLADTASWLERLIPSRPHVPVLGGALLTAGDDGLTAAAFDYDQAATATVPADVTEPGTVLVSGRLLAAIAKTIPKTATVTVSCDAQQANVTAGRGEWVLPLLPVEDYPTLPDLGPSVGTIEASVFADAAAKILPAVGRDDAIPQLTGVKIEAEDGSDKLTFAATDRFRLATVTVPWQNTGGVLDLLVPGALVAQMVRGATGTLQLHADTSGTAAGFGASSATRSVTGRLLDATFPAWRRLLTHDADHWVTVDTAALIEALEQVAVYGDRAIYRVDVTAERIELSAADENRTARADTEVIELAGEPVTVGINPTYLRDALSGLGETTRIYLQSGTRPWTFHTDGDTKPAHSHLVVPVRLQGGERAA